MATLAMPEASYCGWPSLKEGAVYIFYPRLGKSYRPQRLDHSAQASLAAC